MSRGRASAGRASGWAVALAACVLCATTTASAQSAPDDAPDVSVPEASAVSDTAPGAATSSEDVPVAAPATTEPVATDARDASPDATATPIAGPSAHAEAPPTPPPAAPAPDAAPQGDTGRPHRVSVLRDARGFKLQVDGRDFMVLGMNWSYVPIGENYAYSLWEQEDSVIEEALRNEMELLRDMGVNAIRQYVGIPARWIRHIYERYGIYTILNHPMGRYGHSIDGVWRSPTDYADPRTREVLLGEITALAEAYRDTPGLLMWLLGNENNYGLYWSSTEIENLPEADQGDARATYLYSLFGQAIDVLHGRDSNHPVGIANGDLQFIDVIRRECPHLDIMGANVYRGPSSGDLFDRVAAELDLPFFYTEFGSDAFDAREGREDDLAQAEILLALWQEIYEQAHGRGRAQNAIGGVTFQWSDGWWKYRQEVNLDVHDTNASWANGGYRFDFVQGENNMNEEWFGICAIGRPNARGIYRVYPRTAYYVLRDAYRLDPYAESTTLAAVREHFGAIHPADEATHYAARQAMNRLDALELVRMAFMRVDLETSTSGGSQLADPARESSRFDSTQSFYAGFELQPAARVRASLTLNILGNVAQNRINEIFYENRGIARTLLDAEGDSVALSSLERIAVYQSSLSWEESSFRIDGFYRVGQNHWGYDGDFFNLVPETHYQPAVDAFNANVPIGLVFNGRRELEGLRIAFGPELWWGANPTIIGLYHRTFGDYEVAVMHQEDFAQREAGATSSAIPSPQDRRSTVYLSGRWGALRAEVGGIMAGSPRIGRPYQSVRPSAPGAPSYLGSGLDVFDDAVGVEDTLGARARLRVDAAPFYWYLQGGYRGLVADAGWDPTVTFTGWSMKESGQGNHWAVSTGAAWNLGDVQIAPNFLVQRPLEGPLPALGDFFDRATGVYYPGLNGRNQLEDPFWVRSNRETYGFELMLAFDPTPATWMWAWDNVRREDADFAAFLDMSYRIHPTRQDAGIGVTAQGVQFAFPTSAPASDLWDVRFRTIARLAPGVRLVNMLYVGNGQANGNDARLIYRGGVEGRLTADRFSLDYHVRIGDWGPYDYYRDFNSTFPLQAMLNGSFGLTNPQWFVSSYTRLGVVGTFRALDANSGRYRPDPMNPDAFGTEWEVRTYVQLSI